MKRYVSFYTPSVSEVYGIDIHYYSCLLVIFCRQGIKEVFEQGTVDFALKDVKEYAARTHARTHDLNSLQLKLMHLEDLGRHTLHEDSKLYSKVLERFQVRKDHPEVGSIILTLLSSSTGEM